MNFTIPTSQQLGAKMHKIARICAVVLVFAYVISRDVYNLIKVGAQNFMKIAYDAGYNTGTFVHTLNDKLSAISVALHAHPLTTITKMINTQTPAPAYAHPLAQIANELNTLTVPQLKHINSTKKKYKKQELIDMCLVLA
jgi:pheromone shutdown protein TraB